VSNCYTQGRDHGFIGPRECSARGSNVGMAAFIAMTSWRGEFTDTYFTQLEPDPVRFGMPAGDDGSRDDPLLSDRSWAVSSYRLDASALAAAPARVVIAVGEESLDTFTGRTSLAIAELFSRRPCSRATTAASSAASTGAPASPRHSLANCDRFWATTTDAVDHNARAADRAVGPGSAGAHSRSAS
jgi:hypothetical protein